MEMYAVAGALLVVVVGVATGFVAGVRVGRGHERAATNRYLHDSVLPTFEAFGLATAADVDHAPRRLADLRRAARAHAVLLRGGLSGPDRLDGLVRNLDVVLVELAHQGLHVEFTAATDPVLRRRRTVAVREAVREALRNTLRHAGVDRAEVRVGERRRCVAVTVTDRGRGFDAAMSPAGFGIRESIVGRIAEVGGRASVESWPGAGTSVTLWVPR